MRQLTLSFVRSFGLQRSRYEETVPALPCGADYMIWVG